MLRLQRARCLLAIAAGFSAAGIRSQAVDASDVLVYSIGEVRVRPHVALAEQYDDNIFYRSSHTNSISRFPAESDFITTISPGVSVQLGRREANHLTLDYTMDQSWYLDHRDEGHSDHSVLFNTFLEGYRLSLTGNDHVQFLSGILGGGQNLGQKVDRFTFSDDYRLDYRLGEKTSVYLAGDFSATDYEKGTPLYDENTIRGTGGFSFKATEKTSVFGELYYGQSATDPNTNGVGFAKGPHADFFGGFVGARGDFTSRLKGSVKAGYESRQYSDGTPASSSPVVEATLDQRFSDRTLASLTYTRRNSLSVQVARQAYTSDAVGAQIRQVLSSDGKFVVVVAGNFENDDYERSVLSAARHDRVYRANLGLTYNIQLWLSARLGYQFEKYDSNVVIDYHVNSVTLSIQVGY